MSACGKIISSNVSYLGTQNEIRASDVTNQQISILTRYKRLKKGSYIVTKMLRAVKKSAKKISISVILRKWE